jgi:polyisoprenoid-binding protein YceI
MKKFIIALLALFSIGATASEYIIDKKGMHAFINFKVSHLGYSWVMGRFNDFDGSFSYDEKNPKNSKIKVTINTKSVDSNHAERDKHLKGEDFLNVKKYPQASFISTSFTPKEKNKATLKGKFTLNGTTKDISIDVKKIGEGKDPWGGYRIGFEGTTSFVMADFGIKKNLGPASKKVHLHFVLEGIKK